MLTVEMGLEEMIAQSQLRLGDSTSKFGDFSAESNERYDYDEDDENLW